ncbi:aminopeptidase [Galbibacter marinus]|uniref:Aminopeptidase N n=1 Tax=Galbibacter marinus TaxID=555500 RepID=K2P501_9FLAO|nr:M1 family metallopeptidase [Galbibacter marinus]EKF56113.1 aminopeptidase [Galbibacter marinus]
MLKKNVLCSLILICCCVVKNGFAQQIHQIDIIEADVNVALIPSKKKIHGEVSLAFKVLRSTDSLVIDARDMEIHEVRLDKNPIDFSYQDNLKLKIYNRFHKGDDHLVEVHYQAKPKKAMYFIDDPNGQVKQIWTQGQGKYSSYWLPSFDDMNEKIIFDLTIKAPEAFTVLANGKLKQKHKIADQILWEYDMKNPMSSYLLAIAMGNFDFVQTQSKSGVKIKNYFNSQDKAKVEPTYRYTTQIMNFYEDEIGVRYPWQEYKQVGVQDFLYAGMENTTLTIFSDSYMVDSIAQKDQSYFNVNAHELAHHWFGNMVTETESTHHWLQEGFATYYALLAAKEIIGDDHFYLELYKSAMDLEAQAPESLLNPKASSLTFYQRGAWVLVALRETIGDRSFKKTIKTFLKEHAYKNVDTHDFFNVAMAKSQLDLDSFIDRWLVQKEFPIQRAKEILRKNELTAQLLDLKQMDDAAFESFVIENPEIYNKNNKTAVVSYIVQRASTLGEDLMVKVYKRALQSSINENKQSVAVHIVQIPEVLKNDFEVLLTSASYKTIELALLKLSINFPGSLPVYLDQTKGIDGFKNKNIKTLWLALALISPDYHKDKKYVYYNTLLTYTNTYQPYELRWSAFRYLGQLEGFNEPAIKNLIQACLHPVWQFSKFSRELLDSLLSQPAYHGIITGLKKDLNKQEQRFLNDRLDQ